MINRRGILSFFGFVAAAPASEASGPNLKDATATLVQGEALRAMPVALCDEDRV